MHLQVTTYQTRFVGYRPFTNALHGERFAREVGRPLNYLITINFRDLGLVDGTPASTAFSAILRSVSRDWKRSNRSLPPFYWVCVHANPNDIRHVHWFAHVPESFRMEFREILERRVQEAAACPVPHGALHTKDVPEGAPRVMKYIGRGVPPSFVDYFHLPSCSDEGLVTGRRIQTSRNLSRAARDRGGWSRKRAASWNKAA